MATDETRATLATLRDGERQLETLDRLSARFGASLGQALATGAEAGRRLSGSLDGVAASIGSALAKSATASAGDALRGLLQGASLSLSPFSGAAPFAAGGVLAGGRVQPFAAGGVVAAPTYFPLARGLGLMGEAGAEAILPLARGPDGRLGVRVGGGAPAPAVTVNIATTDAESFRRSEAQVAAALARAVARGRRGL
ncbi:MAG: phage tail tape measure protein [Methylobacteriaceae bacterium]|nr:phage tail tape measure protein [Methylobacteriaceae bacterium]